MPGKTTQRTMEAKLKCRLCRRGVLFPTSTTIYYCYHCQRGISSQSYGEAKVTCGDCGGEFKVPTSTTAYRCSICQTVTTSISGRQSEDGGKQGLDGAKLFKHDRPDRANKNANMQNDWSSSSMGSSLALSGRCNKRAVLCGVTYTKRKFRLKGTINDVSNMRELLVKIFDFPIDCIRILTEQEKNPVLVPTKKNILESLEWLVKDCQPGDSLVFYFSGHGLQQPDFKEDEIDGFDETLCPVDFLHEGLIIDNDLNSIIVRPLIKGVTLHAIVDACHSGTILDLTYVYNQDKDMWEDNKPPAKEPIKKHTSGGLAISLSACEDGQLAADTTAFGKKGMNGVLTYLFTKTIKDNPDITYGGLLEKIHEEMEKIRQSKCRPSILQRVFGRTILQDPSLSSSEQFDVSKKIFTL